jgi:polyhydroxybutyrate depolymerase
MLHGAGGDAERIRSFTARGLERTASAGRWLVVYPEGVEGTWNDCRRSIPYAARRLDTDDVGFLAVLIEDLTTRYGVQASDVLVAGFSNGGQMALRLALERPDLLNGLAMVGAQLPVAAESLCPQQVPALHYLHIAGTHDPLLPFGGGASAGVRGEPLGMVQSATVTADAFVAAAGGSPGTRSVLPERDGDPATSARLLEWRPPARVIRQYVLEGAGHVIPQRETHFPPVAGRSAGDMDFATAVLEFMALWEDGEERAQRR